VEHVADIVVDVVHPLLRVCAVLAAACGGGIRAIELAGTGVSSSECPRSVGAVMGKDAELI
jgi:hypothetical protein